MSIFGFILLFLILVVVIIFSLSSMRKRGTDIKKPKYETKRTSEVKKKNFSKSTSNNKLSTGTKTDFYSITMGKQNIPEKTSNNSKVYSNSSIHEKNTSKPKANISKSSMHNESSKHDVSKITYNSLNVKQPDSNHGVYYLERYVKYSKWDEYPQYRDASRLLLDYKNNNSYAIRLLTIDLIKGILYISKNKIKENIDYVALVSIPPSNIMNNDTCPMKRSIKIIKNTYDNNILECNKQILDYSDLLYRSISVKPARLCGPGERPTKQLHIQTISCRKKNISDNIAFILMDDITTKGTIMYACEEILINNGVKRENIFKLAIAGTMWVY